MAMRYYTIYQLTNTLNGKIYIGCHVTENLDDGYMGSGTRLGYAKRKYGIAVFTKEILSVHESVREMLAEEARLVTKEFLARPDVYNLIPGGHVYSNGAAISKALRGRTLSEETKLRMSEAQRKRIRRPTGPLSEETKSKIAERAKCNRRAVGSKRTVEHKLAISKSQLGNSHAVGAVRSEEHKQAISRAHKGRVFSEESRRKMSESKKGNKNAKRSVQAYLREPLENSKMVTTSEM